MWSRIIWGQNFVMWREDSDFAMLGTKLVGFPKCGGQLFESRFVLHKSRLCSNTFQCTCVLGKGLVYDREIKGNCCKTIPHPIVYPVIHTFLSFFETRVHIEKKTTVSPAYTQTPSYSPPWAPDASLCIWCVSIAWPRWLCYRSRLNANEIKLVTQSVCLMLVCFEYR